MRILNDAQGLHLRRAVLELLETADGYICNTNVLLRVTREWGFLCSTDAFLLHLTVMEELGLVNLRKEAVTATPRGLDVALGYLQHHAVAEHQPEKTSPDLGGRRFFMHAKPKAAPVTGEAADLAQCIRLLSEVKGLLKDLQRRHLQRSGKQ